MGIDVWFERPRDGEARAERQVVEKQPGAVATLTSTQPLPQVGEARSAPPPRPQVKPHTGPLPAEPALAVRSVPADKRLHIEPFVLACIRGSGVLLLTGAPLMKNLQRMAQDIVRAVMSLRRFSATDLQVIEYRYPPAADLGLDRVGSPDRALRAFLSVQRQIAGIDAGSVAGHRGLILITQDANSLFRDWLSDPHEVIDDLANLAGDAARKRALWLRLSAAL